MGWHWFFVWCIIVCVLVLSVLLIGHDAIFVVIHDSEMINASCCKIFLPECVSLLLYQVLMNLLINSAIFVTVDLSEVLVEALVCKSRYPLHTLCDIGSMQLWHSQVMQ